MVFECVFVCVYVYVWYILYYFECLLMFIPWLHPIYSMLLTNFPNHCVHNIIPMRIKYSICINKWTQMNRTNWIDNWNISYRIVLQCGHIRLNCKNEWRTILIIDQLNSLRFFYLLFQIIECWQWLTSLFHISSCNQCSSQINVTINKIWLKSYSMAIIFQCFLQLSTFLIHIAQITVLHI